MAKCAIEADIVAGTILARLPVHSASSTWPTSHSKPPKRNKTQYY